MAKKDKVEASISKKLYSLEFENDWGNYTCNEEINRVLSKASKAKTGNPGFPDHLNVNENKKLLIMIEDKNIVGDHCSGDSVSEPEKYAVDGIKWYLKAFVEAREREEQLNEYFKYWKIIGIAISGDIEDDYNHKISTFVITSDNKIQEQKQITNIQNEEDYLNLFSSFDEEKIINDISISSKKINKWLRSIDSQKRPILLSALMICLFEIKNGGNSFINEYNSNTPSEIVKKIQDRVEAVLKSESIPMDKIQVICNQLSFINDYDIKNTSVLKDILNELRENIIPLFKRRSNYDIIGRFYEEFLRYAGVTSVKKGIVLTPSHITTLFTDLVDIKYNDIILDPACGTGSFLIAGMNKITDLIQQSEMLNKDELIRKVKTTQLIGFETNSTMYSLAISNMLFRGDGKSQIFYLDFFSKEADSKFAELKAEGIIPTIGFINPPYSGKDTKDDPTKKEIQFLTRMLEHVTRYGIIIAPLSTYFKDKSIRNAILKKHTLKCVINMPQDLFMPNAASTTAVAVFETNKPHNNQEVVFYDLRDDGYVLYKGKGRTDLYNKWSRIKKDTLKKIKYSSQHEDNITLVQTKIKDNDEWLIQAHSKTDYSNLNESSFVNAIKSHMIFKVKKEMDLIDKDIDEIQLLEIVSDYYSEDDLATKENIGNGIKEIEKEGLQ